MTERMGHKGFIKPLLTHCCRELMHAQWMILLDNEFIEVHKHGIIILCCNGVLQQFYPCTLTYLSDYPEK